MTSELRLCGRRKAPEPRLTPVISADFRLYGFGTFAAKPPWRLGRAIDQDHVEVINGVFEVLVAPVGYRHCEG